MAYQKPVLREKLHTSPKVMTQNDLNAMHSTAEVQRTEVELRQEQIDNYNFVECNEIDDFFKTVQLEGDVVIIKLHKENFIKSVTEIPGGKAFYETWISQVDGRSSNTAPAKWIDNPLPYVNTGVIMAISPTAKYNNLERIRKVAETNPELASSMKELNVGDIVHLRHIDYANTRFYTDKQRRDFIKNPEEYKIEHWKGYVIVHPSVIEAVVLDKDEFTVTSPYYTYKNKSNNAE